MQNAYYSAPINDFVVLSAEAVLGELAKRNPFALDPLQRNAWLSQIDLARAQCGKFDGWIAFEFAIPRMGKRADVVLITAGIVFVIEFKIGSHHFDAVAFDQVVDYALDLKNFHAGSHDRRIVPIVVATMANDGPVSLTWGSDGVASPIASNGSNLSEVIEQIITVTPEQVEFDGGQWSRTGYKPTPTIIEAAQALYQGHRVEEITRSDAGAKNFERDCGLPCRDHRGREGKSAEGDLLCDRSARRRKDVGRPKFGDSAHQSPRRGACRILVRKRSVGGSAARSACAG
jgi:hypothetical protein